MGTEVSTDPSTCRVTSATLLPREEMMNEQRREEKQNIACGFSHKAPAQAIVNTKGMPPIANTLRTISAISPRILYTLAYTDVLSQLSSSTSSSESASRYTSLSKAGMPALRARRPRSCGGALGSLPGIPPSSRGHLRHPGGGAKCPAFAARL